jgi:hypothetical protein
MLLAMHTPVVVRASPMPAAQSGSLSGQIRSTEGGVQQPFPIRVIVERSDTRKSVGTPATTWDAAHARWSFTVSGLPLGTPLVAYVENAAPGPISTGFAHITMFQLLGSTSEQQSLTFTLTKAKPKTTATFVPFELEVFPLPIVSPHPDPLLTAPPSPFSTPLPSPS